MNPFGFFSVFSPDILNISTGTEAIVKSKLIFNEHQRRVLEANPNVKAVSDRHFKDYVDYKQATSFDELRGLVNEQM
ncbi:hypothetical protein NCCP2050_25960 [Planococcus sp. NCCP-2050]|nr:hypothetical protein NCCP2050_25960 [Planococcus sp. NCCP-2050]